MNLRSMFAGAAVASVLVLGGCGSGDDHSGSTAASAGTTTAATSGASSSQQDGTANSTANSTASASKNSFALGSPADVPRTDGGDNSIQDYGSEASRSDRAAAGRALAAYYGALGTRDTEEACTLLSSSTRQKIELTLKQLEAQGGAGSQIPQTCPELLKLTARIGAPGAPNLHLSELLSLRRQDESAFLIYKAGDGKVYAMPMSDADGGWKVSGVSAAPLVGA